MYLKAKSLWWNYLESIRRCGSVGGDILLGVALRLSLYASLPASLPHGYCLKI